MSQVSPPFALREAPERGRLPENGRGTMRKATRAKVARFVSRRLPGMQANWDKACVVALIHALEKEGILVEREVKRRAPRKTKTT